MEFSFLNGNLMVPSWRPAYFDPAARGCAPQKGADQPNSKGIMPLLRNQEIDHD
jgi:hypothetical protein